MELTRRLLNLAPFVAALLLVGWLYYRARIATGRRGAGRPVRLDPESKYAVVVTPHQIAVHAPDGALNHVEIEQLQRIVVRTNALGPWLPDFWWEFHGSASETCSFPQGATGESAVLELASTLPGFDFEQLNSAMGSTSDAEFLCWERPNNSSKPTPLRGAA